MTGIPKFEENVKISTRTYIIIMNVKFDLIKLHNILTAREDYVLIIKKRGRKIRNYNTTPNLHIPKGSIITIFPLEGHGEVKGVDIKRGKKKKKCFSNAIAINMMMNSDPEKIINFKVFKNGKIEMTGPTCIDMAQQAIKYFWSNINMYTTLHPEEKDLIYKQEDESLIIYFDPVLCNLGFDLGFIINRDKLNWVLNKHTSFRSLWDTNFNYAGVVIKKEATNIDIIMINFIKYNKGVWSRGKIPLSEFEKIQNSKIVERSPSCKQKVKGHSKNVSLFAFHTGKVNMSSRDYDIMGKYYNEFYNIILEHKDYITETLS